MYIAMNRFKIKIEHEAEFIDIWKQRDSHLTTVPGFISFNLLQGATDHKEGYSLISSHAIWQSKEAFVAWTKSAAFKKAHAGAGNSKDMHVDRPQLECFDVVI